MIIRSMSYGTFPSRLDSVSVVMLALGVGCAAVVAIDEVRHPQRMWIMNLVWPLTALFGSLIWLAAYFAWGRQVARQKDATPPMPVMVFKGSSHCGAGCTLGDIVAEWGAYAFPSAAVWFAWGSLFGEKTFAVWILDFVLAYLIGIMFQYFTIAPMRGLPLGKGIVAALKTDTASIAAWQVGMYGVMAIIQFVWFKQAYGGLASVASPEFWFAMQLAMLAGFLAAYPVNWWLIRISWKERM